jgi:hypothetical protein
MHMVLQDESWRDLGFKRRPRHGAIFNRLRPHWKVTLEDKVLQEILSIFSAAYIVAKAAGWDLQRQLVKIYLATPELVAAFGYDSRMAGVSALTDSMNEFVSAAPRQWDQILLRHLSALKVPDRRMWARLTVGCIQFSRNVEHMIVVLREAA